MNDAIDVRCARFSHRGGMYENVTVRAGIPNVVHVVPPSGEKYAFDRVDYPHEVQITVSPTGRSVQVYVDGKRVA